MKISLWSDTDHNFTQQAHVCQADQDYVSDIQANEIHKKKESLRMRGFPRGGMAPILTPKITMDIKMPPEW